MAGPGPNGGWRMPLMGARERLGSAERGPACLPWGVGFCICGLHKEGEEEGGRAGNTGASMRS